MDSRNLEKAMEIYSKLIMGEEIRKSHKVNGYLYEEYYQNGEVYDILGIMLNKLNLSIYEYNDALFITAGEGNKVFGYTNEELKRSMGLRYNKELYLAYFIMYNVLLSFYTDSSSYQFQEYIRLETIISDTSKGLENIVRDLGTFSMDQIEENSFKAIGLLWDELPPVTREDNELTRASKASRAGFTKIALNFLIGQGLFIEVEDRYYPTDRFKALAENYFEEYRGRLYQVLQGGNQDA